MRDGETENVIGLDAAIESAAEKAESQKAARGFHVTWDGTGRLDFRTDGVLTEIDLWAAARLIENLGDEQFWQRRAQQVQGALVVPTPGSVKGLQRS